jgi:hypothetical protein
MRKTVTTISMDPLQTEMPDGVEAEVIFVQSAIDASFDRARRHLNRSCLGALPRHLTINCVQGMWDGVVALGIAMGTKGNGYLDRVFKAVRVFTEKHPRRALCIWIDEAQMLTQRDREGIFRLLKYVCEELEVSARICLVLRRKQIREFDGKRWKWAWKFPVEGERLRQIARLWTATDRGLNECERVEDEETEQTAERRVASA